LCVQLVELLAACCDDG